MAKVAVLGHGVVGSGVVDILTKNFDTITAKTGKEIKLKYVLDIKIPEEHPNKECFTTDIDDILNDFEVTVVVESIGGLSPAFDFIKSCLRAKKHVVTANKELVAKKGAELLAIAKENNVKFLFEASVGGGIPIIRPLNTDLVANNILSISGILNGTSNYILTKMKAEGRTFDDVLKEAQSLGYAEADPSADVDGHDTCRKICILASIACGEHVYPDNVHVEGIRGISQQEIEIADKAGYAIKLIGKAYEGDDDLLHMIVAPMMVSKKTVLGNVNDVFNAVEFVGDMVGEVIHYGPGAGKLPTASAVVSDIVECVCRPEVAAPFWKDSSENNVANHLVNKTSQMIRYSGEISLVETIFGEIIDISPCAPAGETAFLTPYYLTEIQVNEKVRLLEMEGGKVLSAIRVLGDADRWGL